MSSLCEGLHSASPADSGVLSSLKSSRCERQVIRAFLLPQDDPRGAGLVARPSQGTFLVLWISCTKNHVSIPASAVTVCFLVEGRETGLWVPLDKEVGMGRQCLKARNSGKNIHKSCRVS